VKDEPETGAEPGQNIGSGLATTYVATIFTSKFTALSVEFGNVAVLLKHVLTGLHVVVVFLV
jgi:hypothetical protein